MDTNYHIGKEQMTVHLIKGGEIIYSVWSGEIRLQTTSPILYIYLASSTF